jgi:hypothetical protein
MPQLSAQLAPQLANVEQPASRRTFDIGKGDCAENSEACLEAFAEGYYFCGDRDAANYFDVQDRFEWFQVSGFGN